MQGIPLLTKGTLLFHWNAPAVLSHEQVLPFLHSHLVPRVPRSTHCEVGGWRVTSRHVSIRPFPNEVGYRRGTTRISYGPFSLPSSRTGRDHFCVIRLSNPYFRKVTVEVPAWMASWHFRQTTRVLRRRAAICFTQTGFSFLPGFSKSANLRI